MCNVRAVMILVVALGVSGRLQAQTHEELQARAAAQRARIDSLRPLYDSAQAEVQRMLLRPRAAARRTERLDTVGVGPFLVVGRAREVAAAAPLLERAWSDYTPLVGGAAARLKGVVFIVRGDNAGAVLRGLNRRPRQYYLDLPAVVRYRDRIRSARAAIGLPLRELLPPALQQWIGEGRFGAGRELDRAYRELAIGNSRGAERCHDGDLTSCAGILGLAGDTAWQRFYTAPQLREMVRRSMSGGGEQYTHCVALRIHAACVALLNRRATAPLPVSRDTRVVLLEHALMRGGDGSFERMIADSTADVRTALTAASGSAVPQLLASWRQSTLAARPSAAAWLGGTLLVTVLWIGVFVMMANRSTRWRIG